MTRRETRGAAAASSARRARRRSPLAPAGSPRTREATADDFHLHPLDPGTPRPSSSAHLGAPRVAALASRGRLDRERRPNRIRSIRANATAAPPRRRAPSNPTRRKTPFRRGGGPPPGRRVRRVLPRKKPPPPPPPSAHFRAVSAALAATSRSAPLRPLVPATAANRTPRRAPGRRPSPRDRRLRPSPLPRRFRRIRRPPPASSPRASSRRSRRRGVRDARAHDALDRGPRVPAKPRGAHEIAPGGFRARQRRAEAGGVRLRPNRRDGQRRVHRPPPRRSRRRRG